MDAEVHRPQTCTWQVTEICSSAQSHIQLPLLPTHPTLHPHFLKLCVASWWTFKPLCTQIPGLGSVSSDWEPRGWNSGYVTLNACDLSTLSWRLG